VASPAGGGGGGEGVAEGAADAGVSEGVKAVGVACEASVGVAGLAVDGGVALEVGEGVVVALRVGRGVCAAVAVGVGVGAVVGEGDGVALGCGLDVGTGVGVDVDTSATLVGARVGVAVGAVEVHLAPPRSPSKKVKTSPCIQFARIFHLVDSIDDRTEKRPVESRAGSGGIRALAFLSHRYCEAILRRWRSIDKRDRSWMCVFGIAASC
jgi:hypothetical protein